MNKLAMCFTFSALLSITAIGGRTQVSLDQRVDELSQQISKEMADNQKTTIAVIEFVDLKGNITDFGRYLAEKLITKLYQTKKFKVIERQLLNRVIAEQKLNLTGMIDPSAAKQLGKLLGVDAICSGTVSDLAQTLDVNGRLISTETGEIFAVASAEITKDEAVRGLLESTKNVQEAASKNPFAALGKPKPPTYETTAYRVTVDSIRKSGNTVTIVMFFESLSESEFDLAWRGDLGETYLLDENGEKWWLTDFDSGGIIWRLGASALKMLPKTRIKSKFVFTTKNDATGGIFSLASIEAAPGRERQVLIHGLKLQ